MRQLSTVTSIRAKPRLSSDRVAIPTIVERGPIGSSCGRRRAYAPDATGRAERRFCCSSDRRVVGVGGHDRVEAKAAAQPAAAPDVVGRSDAWQAVVRVRRRRAARAGRAQLGGGARVAASHGLSPPPRWSSVANRRRWCGARRRESGVGVREVRGSTGEDVPAVADFAGREWLVVPGHVRARVAVVRDEGAP